MKEQREADYAPTLDQVAGQAARRIIHETSMDDTTEHWRAVKRAYIRGYEDAQRAYNTI